VVRADCLQRAHHIGIAHLLAGTRGEDDVIHGDDIASPREQALARTATSGQQPCPASAGGLEAISTHPRRDRDPSPPPADKSLWEKLSAVRKFPRAI
jgi:hypothetical protein